jgi:hypothetical protein
VAQEEEVSWRKLLILAIILVLIGGLYVWDLQRIKADKAREEEQKKLFPWTADKVTALRIQRASGVLELSREEKGEWILRAPVQANADPDQVISLLEGLLRARRDRSIAEESKELGPYGLDRPEVSIALKGKEPDGERVLMLGAKNPTEVYYYAQLQGEKAIFMVSDVIRREANKEAFDLREKFLWKFPAARVEGLTLSSGGQGLSLRREPEGSWRIMDPGSYPGDKEAVESLLFRLSRLKAVGFEDGPKPLEEMGLDPPRRQILLRLKEPQEEKRLDVGGELPKGEGKEEKKKPRLYVREAGRTGAAVVEAQTVGDLSLEVADWRDKSLLAFERDRVRRVEIHGPNGALALSKVAQTQWEIEQPERLPADSLKVNDLLWALKDARVYRFLDADPALSWEEPALQVSLWTEGTEEPLKLLLGRPTPDGQGLYARAPAQDKTVVVAPKLAKDLNVSVKEMRDRRLLSFDIPKLQRVQIIWEGKTLDLHRKGETWKVQAPSQGEVEAHRVTGLLWALREAKFEDLLRTPPEPGATGKDSPKVKATLWTQDGEVGPLVIGKSPPDRPNALYAWVREDSPVYLLEAKFLDDLKQEIKGVSAEFFPAEPQR